MKNEGEKVKESPVKSRRKILLITATIAAVAVLLIVTAIYVWKHRPGPAKGGAYATQDAPTPKEFNPYQVAVEKVEEERGEPVGNKARIDVPAELKLYKDRNRFLAIQVAESLEQKYEIPHDFAELAEMIKRGEFETLPALGNGYILYGVGLKANADLTHFDEKSGKSVPLFASEAEMEAEKGRLNDSIRDAEAKTEELKKDLSQVPKGKRGTGDDLRKQISETQKFMDETRKSKELIESFYNTEEHRRLMVDEYQKLQELAGDFGGRSFNLNDMDSRKEFKIALLSMLRAPARAMLEEIGRAYEQKFERPLPVTSLLRTKEYQKYLGESGNPNAIDIAIPPHTTGLAFDIFTHYMTAGEQQFLIDEVARLKRDGRVEALRENRDHIHVFAFADGQRPSEALIKDALKIAKRD